MLPVMLYTETWYLWHCCTWCTGTKNTNHPLFSSHLIPLKSHHRLAVANCCMYVIATSN